MDYSSLVPSATAVKYKETRGCLLARALPLIRSEATLGLQSLNGKNRTKEVSIMLLKSARLVQKFTGMVLGGMGAAVLAGNVLICVALLALGPHAILNTIS